MDYVVLGMLTSTSLWFYSSKSTASMIFHEISMFFSLFYMIWRSKMEETQLITE